MRPASAAVSYTSSRNKESLQNSCGIAGALAMQGVRAGRGKTVRP